ncbi:hypothetical protein MKW98_019328 [Papaver atlanticum]|uniref:Uncharacterized protein n=1 Tax=Papaver atlanticum TaxID=357466 RepID=A0AAD4S9U4_9MAGN|nr:hypothetical protein MKW98_019328 [Papaver atlanticum]
MCKTSKSSWHQQLSSESKSGQIVEVGGKEIHICGPTRRESILTLLFKETSNTNLIDFTVPAAVNVGSFKLGCDGEAHYYRSNARSLKIWLLLSSSKQCHY